MIESIQGLSLKVKSWGFLLESRFSLFTNPSKLIFEHVSKYLFSSVICVKEGGDGTSN
jgi:hypothetical protein